jgi:hypothetical protein
MMARRPQTAGGKRTSLAMRDAKKRAPSNTDDDKEEDSHSSAASSESEQQTDDGGGKQQAGVYEEAKVDTDEEVTSLTSSKAKITKNEFMAIHGHFFGVWSNYVVRGTGFLQFGLTIRHF